MEPAPPPTSPLIPVITSSVVIIGNDPLAIRQLQTVLAGRHGCPVDVVPTASAVAGSLVAGECPTLMVLPDQANQETCAVLSELGENDGTPLPVVGVLPENADAPPTGVDVSLFHGWAQMPLSADELLGVLSERLAHALFAGAGDPPQPLECAFNDFVYRTYSRDFHHTLSHLTTVAKHDVTILLVGQTGTGKTTMARLIHELSTRSTHALLTVACGALPADLIESELFGHVKGAFTGADYTKIGRFAAAGHGTLLLDEIDVLSPHQQARLLRVIENGEYEPVGSHKTQLSQARLIVATNENLSQLMERNEFRSDLYYRLNVLEFQIPPLRMRPLDVIPLTMSFVNEFCESHDIQIQRIHPEFLACLVGYEWPGNIRELKNHIRRAVLFSKDGVLSPYDLANDVLRAGRQAMSSRNGRGPETLFEKVATNEQEILETALRNNDYNRSATAAALGISRVGLYKKMKKYGMLDRKKPR